MWANVTFQLLWAVHRFCISASHHLLFHHFFSTNIWAQLQCVVERQPSVESRRAIVLSALHLHCNTIAFHNKQEAWQYTAVQSLLYFTSLRQGCAIFPLIGARDSAHVYSLHSEAFHLTMEARQCNSSLFCSTLALMENVSRQERQSSCRHQSGCSLPLSHSLSHEHHHNHHDNWNWNFLATAPTSVLTVLAPSIQWSLSCLLIGI